MILQAARVVTPARVFAPGWLHLDGDRIVDVGPGDAPSPPDVDLSRSTLVPGYVDTHAHGGGGTSFDQGADAVATVARAHLEHGTTSIVASLVTMEREAQLRAVRELAALTADGLVAGIHLEGPWLSPQHPGAHQPDLLALPTPQGVEELVEAADGRLRMVTLAPELDGGIDAVRRLTAAGVVVAVGHTDASYDVTRTALDAGASVGTHLFNAMRPLKHRDPGPVVALLEHPDTHVELIADGVHLHPAVIRMAAHAKPHQFCLVTDAMAAAAGADGVYRLGPMEVTVHDGEARLADGTIAASTLTLGRAVQYAVTEAGLAIEDAVRAATLTPATQLGLHGIGALRPGYRADLVVLDTDLAVTRVMKDGRWVS